MTTPNDLFSLALLDSGIVGQGQTASAADINNALRRTNLMIGQWARQRWLVYALTTESVTSTGAQSYTVGPGGDFDMPRPDRLESAFQRQPNNAGLPVDWALEIITSREDYNRIALKTLTSFAGSIFYDSAFPIGRVYPWPIPQANLYQIHITVKTPLTAFTSLTQDINLPPEYEEAIYANLVVRLRAAYQLPPDPVFVALAKKSLAVIRGANTQISRLYMPKSVTRQGPWYNILGDLP